MKVVILTPDRNPRLAYTLDFINQHPLIKGQVFFSFEEHGADIPINYSSQGDINLQIPRQGLLFIDAEVSSYHCNAYTHENETYYSVEAQRRPKQKAVSDKQLAFDVFESIFYHISRYEEVKADPSQNYQAGWLNEEEHVLVKYGLEKEPIVDRLIVLLKSYLLNKKEEGSKSTYALSHDIDILYRFKPWYKIPRSILAIVYHRRGLIHLIKTKWHILLMLLGIHKDPYDTFHFLLDKEGPYTQKRLYLMSGGETRHDNLYSIHDRKVERIIQDATFKGYTIGLHPSIHASFKAELRNKELSLLSKVARKEVVLSRQHWLMWYWDKTPALLDHSQIVEDSSMGYSKRLGFRCGTGFPYHLYDFNKEAAYAWKERPLAFMDSALIHESRRLKQTPTEICAYFFKANAAGTHIEMNWHNSNFDPTTKYGQELRTIYTKLDQYLS